MTTATPARALETLPHTTGGSLARQAWRRLWRDHRAIAGAVVLGVLVVLSTLAPWLSSYSYAEQNLALGAVPPRAGHWLGTDALGRDQFTRLLYGGRVSLAVGFCATVVALTIGILYGSIAGYRGGRVEAGMMRVVDALYALPFAIFVILLMVFCGRNFILLFVAIGAVEWLTMARIVRGEVRSLKQRDFVLAAQALGAGPVRIVRQHLLPNLLAPVIVYATLSVPAVMLLEAFLSFLGLGVQAPMSSWGLMISDGAQQMEQAPWLLIAPGLALTGALLALHSLGAALADALDVRTHSARGNSSGGQGGVRHPA